MRIAISGTLLVLACGSPDPQLGRVTVSDSAGIRIVESPSDALHDNCHVAASPEFDIGLVEGPAEYQLYRVFDAATLSDGRVAVVNQGSGEVRLFSPDGRFDSAFGSTGGGPGEFNDIARIWVLPGDTLLIGDYRPWRFSYFSPSGAFLRAVVPEPRYVNPPRGGAAPLQDGSFVLAQECCWGETVEWEWVERELHLVRHDPSGAVIDTLAWLPQGRFALLDDELFIAGPPVFEARSWITAARDRIIIGRGVERELEVYEAAPAAVIGSGTQTWRVDMSRPVGLIRWSGDDRTVTAAEVEAYRRAELEEAAQVPAADREWLQRAAAVMASSERLVADRFPAHADIRMGLGGDVWVREYPRPGGHDQEWLVFSAGGSFECRAFLPFAQPWDLYEIGPDYVLGKERNDLDVEHVRRYSLSRPTRSGAQVLDFR